MSEKHERFIKWYLRFNGYFTVENFVIHAADDPNRISKGHVAPHTETDILGIRSPYSHEKAGPLCIANHPPLVKGQDRRFDVVIAEVKTGNSNNPNSVWREREDKEEDERRRHLDIIKYVVRFVGLCQDEDEVQNVATALASDYSYENNEDTGYNLRIRYVIFAEEENEHYQNKGVTYITHSQVIKFIVETRGQCWVEAGIGVASVHYQWDSLINCILRVANNCELSVGQRCEVVADLLKC